MTWRGTAHPSLSVSAINDCVQPWHYRWGYTSKQSPTRVGLSRWGICEWTSWWAAGSANRGNWSETVWNKTVISGDPFRNEENSLHGSCSDACGLGPGSGRNNQYPFSSDTLLAPNTMFIELRGYPNGSFNAGEATLLAKVDTQVFHNANSRPLLLGSGVSGYNDQYYGMYFNDSTAMNSYVTWFPLLASGSWSHFELSLPYNGRSDSGTGQYNDRADPDHGNFKIFEVYRVLSTYGTSHLAILGA